MVSTNAVIDQVYELPTQFKRQFQGPDVVVHLDPQVQYLKIFGNKDCFVFRFGCVVIWDLNEKRHREVNEFFREY